MPANHLTAGINLNPNDWTTVPGSQTISRINLLIDPALSGGFYRRVFP